MYRHLLNRRHFIALTVLVAAAGNCAWAANPGSSASKPVILVVADSLSAEYGLKRGTGWVALLENKLKSELPGFTVVNASISGDTTAGGRSRLNGLLKKHRPSHVVIELGGNDALRGLPLQLTRDNLTVMTQSAQQAGAKVLLVGMQVPPNYGSAYAAQFANLFLEVGKATQAGVVPFLLKGIADSADPTALFQADRIHPKEEAHPIMLANVWPELKKLLK